jgi:phenylpropionate dioxygenase-like ring-hydroxylating dioxygenase large terminal subunit
LKVVVDGKPLALWRTPTGAVQAISDVCIHRGASLSNGWVQHDRLVCPYHGFEFEGNGNLAYMPGKLLQQHVTHSLQLHFSRYTSRVNMFHCSTTDSQTFDQ